MAKPIEELKKIRLQKLTQIKKLGIDPYPAHCQRNQNISQARKMSGKKVFVAGRIRAMRGHGGIQFFDLQDESGKIQIVLKKENLSAISHKLIGLLDIGDFIACQGTVFKTQAGEISVLVKNLQLLTKAIRPLPEKWHGLTDVETRLRKRYLDLIMSSEVRGMFIQKAKFWQAVRDFLGKKGFLEVETPVLEAIPGGADARPFVTHHNALDIDLYLRISLELHLKRLIVGGYEKVFEIGRVFRNEGIDAEHLQDYTMLEFYWAYADYNDLMLMLEDFYKYLVKETAGTMKTIYKGQEINWSGKWPKFDYSELFEKMTGLNPVTAKTEDLYKKAKELKLKPEKNLGKGRLMDLVYKNTVRPTLIQPCFLINSPVEISPLAKRHPDKPGITQRLYIMAGGSELCNAFSELNDPIDQRQRFEEQQKLREAGDEEAQMYDQDFVEALEYGMPPTAGFGMSERLFAFLVDKPLRETIFFPPMRGA